VEWVRKATGSAAVITNADGEVLLMRRAYPPEDWVLPGGNAEPDESPVETAIREVREELGITIDPTRMTGVYYQRDHRAGEFVHFVFICSMPSSRGAVHDGAEVADYDFFAPDRLPEPMAYSTRRRILDALSPRPQPLPIVLPPGADQP
jgi:8-oxo-dGTP diphosphatase